MNGGTDLTILGILGTTHNPDFRVRYNYPLELLKEVILDFNPSVICGEVHPTSWDRQLKNQVYEEYLGMPASEYWELIFPLCRERNLKFVPIDWFELDIWFEFDYFNKFSNEDKTRLEAQEENLDKRIRETWKAGSIPFNSTEYDQLCKAKYDWIKELNPTAYTVQWEARNLIMAERVKKAMHKNPDERILCVVGADHNYMMYDYLKDGDWTTIYPLRK